MPLRPTALGRGLERHQISRSSQEECACSRATDAVLVFFSLAELAFEREETMSHRIPAIVAITLAVCTVSGVAIFAQSPAGQSVLTRSRYLPEYTPTGELKLPENS